MSKLQNWKADFKLEASACFYLPPGVYQMSVSEAAVPGEEVGRVKAKDPDIGENGLVAYSIIDGDGMDMFEITTDYETQEGVVKLKKVSRTVLSNPVKCGILCFCPRIW